ncbi:RNA-binding S4 domain-containing protein [Donghicola tyrosinivorans]|uniref:Ribosome-associated heat shock protein Hsp15 n=1 Tax=Donghicola tyrosinivorans TaxID=1652492 RepID=A0A2T0WX67_9RHOB|nr:RNA-binding S4 domain-containing protein [Donghicola tyrosinivorans]MEC9197829.1 RNA-binding S4 domain-containing protein [Pseudomonadota bacterium]PRY91174.1 ribosome-associated heat shock protein Hsp15 [Donghicola tyrosinivorans]
MSDEKQKLRVDKWLWHARFFKSRSLAAQVVSAGHVRINSNKISKPSHNVASGDVLTFPQGNLVRVVRMIAPGTRRGPAPEAQALYEDMTPVQEKRPENPSFEGKGRPTGKDRRNLDLWRSESLE